MCIRDRPVEVVVDLFGGEDERHVQLALQLVGGTGPENADDRVRLAVDPNRPTDERRIRVEAWPPEDVGEHDDLAAALDAFLGAEIAPVGERMSHHHAVSYTHLRAHE